jgi:hypothetical protein
MSTLIIDYNFLFEMDSYCQIDDVEKYEIEIESIVSDLWINTGVIEPAFTTYLQTNLLRPLYVCYFSMVRLTQKYDVIIIKHTTTLLDIVANNFHINLPNNRQNHDIEFNLVRNYSFNRGVHLSPKRLFKQIYCLFKVARKVDVLYINAGKLDADFKKIKNALNAIYITESDGVSGDIDAKKIIKESVRNIEKLNISIPIKTIIDLLHIRVYFYLPAFLRKISVYKDFILHNKVKLIVISAATHEDCLSLLAAANEADIESLLIGHGYTGNVNKPINKHLNFQGTINNFEYKYKNTRQFKLRMSWFEENKEV